MPFVQNQPLLYGIFFDSSVDSIEIVRIVAFSPRIKMSTIYKKSDILFASLLTIIWFCAMVYAFWWFQFKDLHTFSNAPIKTHAEFDTASHVLRLQQEITAEYPALFESQKPVVFHLQNPACNCNRFNNLHLQKVVSQYSNTGVQFISLTPLNTSDLVLKQMKILTGIQHIEQNKKLERLLQGVSAPAALVFDGKGTLSYFGPYSNGALCSTKSGQYVETSLDTLLKGETVVNVTDQAFGCFCVWGA